MDNFFQKLRDIQKKERNTGTLAEVDDSFYTDASNYLQDLLKMVNNNPLSLEAYQLRDAQRITTEICERREFKIVSTAATNVQKSHDIFREHKQDSELQDIIPYNVTPEEEEFYRKIVDMMIDHREHLMDKIVINKQSGETKIGFKPVAKASKPETEVSPQEVKPQSDRQTTQDSQPSQKDQGKNEPEEQKKSRPKAPMLDESQIAMMFGQAPDDVLLDENNNPVKPVKKDITTPFKGPKPPVEDTVSLQNETETANKKEEESEAQNISKEETPEETGIQEQPQTTEETPAETEEITFKEVELVELKEEIPTDILDENEKTYGPFYVGDIVSLPKSIVEILNANNVINIID